MLSIPEFPAMNRLVLTLCMVTGVPFSATALPLSHSPFYPREDYTLSLDLCAISRELTNADPPGGTVVFSQKAGVSLRLTVSDYHYVAQVLGDSGPLTDAVNLDVDVVTPDDVLDGAVCADVNYDGETDFVVSLWLHGNSLGASFFNRLVVLSSSNGYRFWVVPTMDPGPEDFVTFGQLEPIVMVTTGYANSAAESDPPHSYFFYDLWTFRGGEIVSANAVDNRFPKWVWMTINENHKPAASLSDTQKQRLRRQIRGPREVIP